MKDVISRGDRAVRPLDQSPQQLDLDSMAVTTAFSPLPLYSISKSWVGTLTGQLLAQELLDAGRLASSYVPEQLVQVQCHLPADKLVGQQIPGTGWLR